MFRRRAEKAPITEPEKIEESKEKPQRKCEVILHCSLANYDFGKREIDKWLQSARDSIEADNYEVDTETNSVKFIFYSREFQDEHMALMFGKRKGVDIESAFAPSIALNQSKKNGGVEVTAED
ncbi:MAG: hypothetical protein HQ539_01295 [Parcubacteria group bacterium]|nr:hypothetical protein [Parcubacteria group bacterium]